MRRIRLRSRPAARGARAALGLALAGGLLGGAALGAAPGAPAAEAPDSSPAKQPATAQGIEFFEKNVRPLLVEHCYQCHRSGPTPPMGGLRVDARSLLLKGGARGPAVVPGNPDASRLIQAVRYQDRSLKMPPRGRLPDEKIALLAEWVRMGAPAPEETPAAAAAEVFDLHARRARHWAFQPLKRPPLPAVRRREWLRTPVDAFILAKLEAAGLAPAAPADRRTLLRRVTYDLTGLPPTPAEIAAFLADRTPSAYERVVERLLASPHYGERWARHWLDLVRYAETDGHEFDFEKPGAHHYRDYVIRALNADVPYDRFVTEHVAGDLLPSPRMHPTEKFDESSIATGFWWLGEGKHSPVDLREDQAERVDNQIDVFSKTFLGLSVGCARCHDHKFDAISTRDYYALFGYLTSSRYRVASLDPAGRAARAAKELAAAREQLQPMLAAGAVAARRPELDRLDAYLLAARRMLHPPAGARAAAADDILFEDFEKPGYDGWKVTGEAFGDRPNRRPLPEYQGDVNAIGAGFVNSHSALAAGARTTGDHLVGTLLSRPFTIQRPFIRFLVGGGAHAGRTCVNLLVDGKAVRTATGRSDNRMEWTGWDVRSLAGREARIEIVDQETGGWGNIGVDQILFTAERDPLAAGAAAAARAAGLDEALLGRRAVHLGTAARDPDDPLHPWAVLSAEPPERFVAARAELLARLEQRRTAARDSGVAFEQFSGPGFPGWFPSGAAFGSGPVRGAAILPGSGPIAGGVAHSARAGEALEGALRSRTFTIEKPRIHFRLSGRGGVVNLVIDGFQRIRNPIYGGLTIAVNADRPRWHSMDVAQWVGHRAYVEILDPGPGWIAADRIVFGEAPPPDGVPLEPVLRLLADPSAATAEGLARGYRDLMGETARAWAAGTLPAGPGGEDRGALVEWLLRAMGPDPGAESSAPGSGAAALEARIATLEAAVPPVQRYMAMADGTGEDERVHIRGSHRSLGPVVPRRFLEAIAGARQPAPAAGSGRLELARRMTAPSNPLLPRVMANRLWLHHFGEGLVRTPDDFGARGERPTHPELLDFLASVFASPAGTEWTSGPKGEWVGAAPGRAAPGSPSRWRGAAWSLKQMHRMMVLSSAYRMDSRSGARAEAADPQNRLLHRMNVRRLEAEAVRDTLLAVSGRLDRSLYGPAVLPHLTPFLEGRGRPARSGPLDGDGRRSIYVGVRRNFLTPLFLAFDYPIPFTTIGKRSVSTVPAQALTMMNNPFVVQQAEAWAKRLLESADEPRARVTRMYETAYGRLPTPGETDAALAFVREREGEADAARAWSDLCHVLLNVKELLFLR